MASPVNRHCAKCIGTLSLPVCHCLITTFALFYFASGRGAECCNERVCSSVCRSVFPLAYFKNRMSKPNRISLLCVVFRFYGTRHICQLASKLRHCHPMNKEDAVDRYKWRKVIKEVRWSGWVWAGECCFWYRPTRVVPDKRQLNGCCCCCCCCHPMYTFTLL